MAYGTLAWRQVAEQAAAGSSPACTSGGEAEWWVSTRGKAIRGGGLATIAPDVTPALALATIESLTVLGALHASPAVKAALLPRMR